jgi:ATP-binding cassette, subfamily F, member 3
MKVRFPMSVAPGKVVVETEKLSKSYGDKHVLEDIDLSIERGARIAFVGQNGQGKSTLAKIIVGELDHTGKLKLGHNVQIGYFAQNQSEYLNGEITLLQTMEDAANDTNRSKVRDMLGAFLFRGDEVEKKVKVLSGGEKNRLALCKMLLQPFNFLVMDEPTNHLDIASKNVLKQALQKFEGTLIVVSHDRDFLQGLTSKVYEFKEEHIKEYLGDINYFLEEYQMDNFREVEKNYQKSRPIEEVSVKKSDGKNQKESKMLQNKLKKVENSVTSLEEEIKRMDEKLISGSNDVTKDSNFFLQYEEKKLKLAELMDEWEKIQLAME